ncbi:hypothetical protein BDW59DRAFT_131539 [Aspergillus cavernicola]|uniref:Glycosyltransferase family 25 protein n=1 Tax=Aspergillus cavernicola TaxID=176166 RepID=A0ABR4IUY2_9EURO
MTRSTVARAFLVRWRWYLCAAGAACTLLWTLYFLSLHRRPIIIPLPHTFSADNTSDVPAYHPPPSGPPMDPAGNATLGFEAILALSPFTSWRTRGLQAAARITGLEIQIPPQPPVRPEMIDAFAGLGPEDARHPNHGSALAWVAHLDLIKHVVQSDMETALIMEDDADWDLSIREQMVGVAEAVRQLTKTTESEGIPYGDAWDVLWLGLCAETWDDTFETVYIDDQTACPAHQYSGLAKGPVERLPPAQRVVFYSGAPICSFAYALTREGAKKVLLDIGAGQDEAFDIALMNGCRERNLTCISVLPELFHHYIPSQNLGSTSFVNGGEEGKNFEIEVEMGSTENILESARCRALWGENCIPH